MSEQSSNSSNTMNIRVTVGKKEDNLKNILNKIDAEKRALFCKEALIQHVLNIKNGSVISAYVDKYELMTDEEKQLASAVTMQDLKDLFNNIFSNASFTLNNNSSSNSNSNDATSNKSENENESDNKEEEFTNTSSSLETNKTMYSIEEEDTNFFDDDDDAPL